MPNADEVQQQVAVGQQGVQTDQGAGQQQGTVAQDASGQGKKQWQGVTQRAFGNAIVEAKEKGKRSALRELDKIAQDAGFGSMAEFIRSKSRSAQPSRDQGRRQEASPRYSDPDEEEGGYNTSPAEARQQPQQPRSSRRAEKRQAYEERKATTRYEREIERIRQEAQSLNQRVRLEKQARRKAEREHRWVQARYDLREKALDAGIKREHADIAVYLVEKELQGKTPDEIMAFDEDAFIQNLPRSNPFLTQEVPRPATTGNAASAVPPAPKPGVALQHAATNGQVDATKMNPKEFEARLRQLGMEPPRM